MNFKQILDIMKKKLLLTFLLFFMASVHIFGQCGNLYIGGVIDGPLSGGTPKGVQICASGDVADLSIYGIGSANNGGGTDGQEFTFPAETISNGDCFWVGSSTTGWSAFFGFTPCYTTNTVNINGDDAIELFCSGALEDLLGDQNVDGTGQCWDHLDGWAVNNSGGPNFGAFDCNDWTFSGANALDGETSNSTAASPYPSPAQTCPAVLPVTLTSFSARSKNHSIELSWITLSEINNNYFEVLRSNDGNNFQSIGKVNGNRNSNKEIKYEFNDNRPTAGLNYYKLKQVDLDGRFEFSYIIKIENKSNKVKIYPTNIVNNINIEIEDVESTTLTIVNNMGAIYKVVSLTSTINSIDILELPTGIYYAKVESPTQYFVERIVKY